MHAPVKKLEAKYGVVPCTGKLADSVRLPESAGNRAVDGALRGKHASGAESAKGATSATVLVLIGF